MSNRNITLVYLIGANLFGQL